MADTIDALRIDPALVAEASALGMDVTRELESALRVRIEKKKRENAWREENREAIQEWNRELEQNGLWYERIERS
jgi:post-segregation antitoxin (ccd killing protein)